MNHGERDCREREAGSRAVSSARRCVVTCASTTHLYGGKSSLLLFCGVAIEAGKSLEGKVIIQVFERLKPCDLTVEVNGKEKTTAFEDDKTM